jgi:hypothetical protein
MTDVGMQVAATVGRPGIPTSKVFHNGNSKIGILSTFYKISAVSMEGKQPKYDFRKEI